MIGDKAKVADNYLFAVRSLRALLLAVVQEYMHSGYASYGHQRRMRNMVASLDHRLQNVIQTHEGVMALYIDEIFKKSFLHLQRHHMRLIGLEAKMLFKCLESSMLVTDAAVLDKITQYKASVEQMLIETHDILKTESGDFALRMAPLTQKQLSICLSIYKYRSELITLYSFLSQSVMTIPEHLEQVENEIYSKGYHV